MKTLLMEYPWIDRETHHYVNFHMFGAYPPLALACIGGNLRKNGIPFETFDAKLEDLSIAETMERVRRSKPDIVGLSAFTSDVYYCNQFARLLKSELPDVIVVVGGPHATVMPAKTLEEFDAFDIAVVGEGEKVMVEIIRALERVGNVAEVPNLAWRKPDGGVQVNRHDEALECRDLDDVGTPVWEMYPPAQLYHVQTARGCPFPCEFCYRLTGVNVRNKSPENVMAEIETILAIAKPDHIYVADPTFGVNKKKVFPILDAMIGAGVGKRVKWRAMTRFNTTTPELLDKMREAGCVSVFFGVESGNEEISSRNKKIIDMGHAHKILYHCRKIGLVSQGGFILGHAGETKKSVWQTVRLILKMRFDMLSIGVMVPWPGTAVYDFARKGEHGLRLLTQDWRNFDKFFGSAVEYTNFGHNYLPRLRLLAYILFYLRYFMLKELFHEVAANHDVAWRVIKASLFGAKRKEERVTDLDRYLSTRSP